MGIDAISNIKDLAKTLGISEDEAIKAIQRDLKTRKAREEYNRRPEVVAKRQEYNQSAEAKLRRGLYQEQRAQWAAMGRKLESVLKAKGMSFEEALELIME